MDQIQLDQYYNKARTFIQEHIQKEILSDEVKNKFIEYYQSINTENAKHIYDSVSALYSDAVKVNRREILLFELKWSGTLSLFGCIIILFGTIGKRFILPSSRFYKYGTHIQIGGSMVLLFSIMLFFAALR